MSENLIKLVTQKLKDKSLTDEQIQTLIDALKTVLPDIKKNLKKYVNSFKRDLLDINNKINDMVKRTEEVTNVGSILKELAVDECKK